MEADRLDSLTRSLSMTGSRRRTLTGLLVGTLGFLGARVEATAARNCKKIKNKQKRKKCLAKANGGCPSGQKPCDGGCIPSTQCCTTADCTGGKTCQNRVCGCAAGSPPCGDICCVVAPGMTTFHIECAAGNSCKCHFAASETCGTNCQGACGFTAPCSDRTRIAAGCSSCGCPI